MLGTGIDIMYRREHEVNGTKCSPWRRSDLEFPPTGTSPAPQSHHPQSNHRRNGSRACWSIETAEYSGTRITSRCALEQIAAFPPSSGNVTNKSSLGAEHTYQAGSQACSPWEAMWGKHRRRGNSAGSGLDPGRRASVYIEVRVIRKDGQVTRAGCPRTSINL